MIPGRTIAIGDIHGYTASLAALLAAMDPKPEDLIVPLGDFVDRGPDAPGTLKLLIELARHCRLAPLLGNHDEMLLSVRAGGQQNEEWLSFGGRQTLDAYGVDSPRQVPEEHVRFLTNCFPFYETETHLFVHASYEEDQPLAVQSGAVLRWESLRYRQPGPHCSGKPAIAGHTAQKDGEILDLGHLKCIDTYCYGGYWLTALDVASGQVWQADPRGQLRKTS
jgi:serine/threonine protein phosphatase 1